MLGELSDEATVRPDGLGLVPTNFITQGPKTVPRVDYERIFILDDQAKLVGEYALRDECPLEYDDLVRAMPVSGMRHLHSFYQGEYVFTPFRVENLWLVVLTHGVLRIEERGSIGTLLAAMRAHLPSSLVPALAHREVTLRQWELEVERRESIVTIREDRVAHLEADLHAAEARMMKFEAEVRARGTRLNALRDYAIEMQQTFRRRTGKREAPGESEENPGSEVSVTPPP